MEAYLNAKRSPVTENPTGFNLSLAESSLQTKVAKSAPTKEHQEFARLRLQSAKQLKPFKVVGLDKPTQTRAQKKEATHLNCLIKVMSEQVRHHNVPNRPKTSNPASKEL